MNKKPNYNSYGLPVWLMSLLTFLCFSPLTVYAASDYPLVEKYISLPVVYGITTVVSFLLLMGYLVFIKARNMNFVFLYVSVFLVNVGYFFLAVSSTIPEALMANRISYLGAVCLPLMMLLIISDVCQIQYSRIAMAILISISAITFVIAASPGFSTVYYKEVYLIFVNGAAKLKKVYGPLHKWYYVYLIGYYLLIIFTVVQSWIKKRIKSANQALFLATITLLNILVWYVEQLFRFDFEFLSVSYIVTELFLLFLYSTVEEEEKRFENILGEIPMLAQPEQTVVNEQPVFIPAEITVLPEEYAHIDKPITIEDIISVWPEVAQLTSREVEVFMYMIDNKRRKDIAEEMFVTESTVKKHTSNIFRKLDISSRYEIMEKIKKINY